MVELNFVKPRLVLIEWMQELKQQIQRLKYYDTVEMKVYRNMKMVLYRRAYKAVKESEYLRFYNKKLNSTKMRYIRKETIEILNFLCVQEMKMDADFELYRRGGRKYRQEVENKWLKNVVLTG